MPKLRAERTLFVAVLLSFALDGGLVRADLDDDIGDATDAGIAFLLKEIEAAQAATGEHDGYKNGKIALETYALVVAGVSVDHPLVRKNFETLQGINLDQTYTVACYAFALDAAMSQLQNDAALGSPSQKLRDDPGIGSAYRGRLEAAVTALVRIRRPKEGDWNYTADRGGFDNSNTQFGVLGLGIGPKHRIPVPKEVWEEIAIHFVDGQKKEGPEVAERPEFYPEDEKGEGKRDRINLVDAKTGEKVKKDDKEKGEKATKDGKRQVGKTASKPAPEPEKKARIEPERDQYFARGWDYKNTGGESWNMTCGGLSSLIIAEQNLRGQVPEDFHRKIKKSIRDGYAWLMKNWNPGGGGEWSHYGLYSLEKVADLSEVKKFGGHDWYQEVARSLLGSQHKDGSWPGGNLVQVRWNTAFALLILNRATSLITQGRQAGMGQKVVLTGAIRRDKEISPDHNWVYIPDFEREFHVPSLLRQVKLRPTPRVLKVLELALKNYPEETRGLLIVNLVKARDEQRNKSVKTFFEEHLAQIVGAKYDTSEKYLAWYKRWVDVHGIGTKAEDPEGLLPNMLAKTHQSITLRKKVIWAVARCHNQALAPQLMEDLAHADPSVRQSAYEALGLLRLSKDPIPGFDPKGDEVTRVTQIAEVRGWYEKRKA